MQDELRVWERTGTSFWWNSMKGRAQHRVCRANYYSIFKRLEREYSDSASSENNAPHAALTGNLRIEYRFLPVAALKWYERTTGGLSVVRGARLHTESHPASVLDSVGKTKFAIGFDIKVSARADCNCHTLPCEALMSLHMSRAYCTINGMHTSANLLIVDLSVVTAPTDCESCKWGLQRGRTLGARHMAVKLTYSTLLTTSPRLHFFIHF